MKKKERNRPNVYGAIRFRIVALALALWLIFMLLFTWSAAAEMYQQLEDTALDYVWLKFGAEDIPGQQTYNMFRHMDFSHTFTRLKVSSPIMLKQNILTDDLDLWLGDPLDNYPTLRRGFESAAIFYDEAGNTLMKSGDYVYFDYTFRYQEPNERLEPAGYGYIDLNGSDPGIDALRAHVAKYKTSGFYSFLPFFNYRMTGWFEGEQFHPTAISYYLTSWTDLFYIPAEKGQELVTIYTDIACIYSQPDKPVHVGGTRFENLTELLDAHIRKDGDWKRCLSNTSLRYRNQPCGIPTRGGSHHRSAWCQERRSSRCCICRSWCPLHERGRSRPQARGSRQRGPYPAR